MLWTNLLLEPSRSKSLRHKKSRTKRLSLIDVVMGSVQFIRPVNVPKREVLVDRNPAE
jgi:hypothetical protein